MNVVVATKQGVWSVEPDGRNRLTERSVEHLTIDGGGMWAISDRSVLLSAADGVWSEVAQLPPRVRANCVEVWMGRVLIGTSEAHIYEQVDGELQPLESFESAEGRDDWYTPWGGPPDVRSMAPAGEQLYVNVHVGGILAFDGDKWSPTIDHHADVHQVIADNGAVLAASARGLATSIDRGDTWEFHTDGLHASYERAVAVCADATLVSASTGPRGGKAAVYRGELGGRWRRCTNGVPGWFDANIDTFWLSGKGTDAAFGTPAGEVFLSRDSGATWSLATDGLPPIRTVLVT